MSRTATPEKEKQKGSFPWLQHLTITLSGVRHCGAIAALGSCIKLTIGSKLACVRRVRDARGRLLSTKKEENSHEAMVPRDSNFSEV